MVDMQSSSEKPVSEWGKIDVERLGGLAGFGLPGARLRSRCTILAKDLRPADQAILRGIFLTLPKGPDQKRDAFRYRLTRQRGAESQTVVVAETEVPEAIRECLRDEIVPP